MPSIETFITFLLALTLLEISPGPDMMLTIARGVGQGRRIALLTVLGNVFVAGFVQVSFLVLGLVTVVHAWPVALDLLRWAGAGYLVWLGVKMILTSGTDTRLRKTAKISDWSAVKEGALNSLTNRVVTSHLPAGITTGLNLLGDIRITWPELDALICTSDEIACGCIMACHGAGQKVPNSLALASLSGGTLAAVCSPALTAVEFPWSETGTVAGKTLLDLLDGTSTDRAIELPSTLQVRASTRKQ